MELSRKELGDGYYGEWDGECYNIFTGIGEDATQITSMGPETVENLYKHYHSSRSEGKLPQAASSH